MKRYLNAQGHGHSLTATVRLLLALVLLASVVASGSGLPLLLDDQPFVLRPPSTLLSISRLS